MSTETEGANARREILQAVMEDLAELREQAIALPDQSQTKSVMDVIEFWETALKECTLFPQLIAWCGKAIADVTHELAVEKYGWDSPEADAVFDEEERKLSNLIRWISRPRSREAQSGNDPLAGDRT